MKTFLYLTTTLLIAYGTYSQALPDTLISSRYADCSTEATSLEDKPWFGNNRHLLEVLQREGFDLPDDYFEQLDKRGLYKGRKLHMRDIKRPFRRRRQRGGGKDRGNAADDLLHSTQSQINGNIYFIPIRLWMHQDANGNTADTEVAIVNELLDAISV